MEWRAQCHTDAQPCILCLPSFCTGLHSPDSLCRAARSKSALKKCFSSPHRYVCRLSETLSYAKGPAHGNQQLWQRCLNACDGSYCAKTSSKGIKLSRMIVIRKERLACPIVTERTSALGYCTLAQTAQMDARAAPRLCPEHTTCSSMPSSALQNLSTCMQTQC